MEEATVVSRTPVSGSHHAESKNLSGLSVRNSDKRFGDVQALKKV